MGKLEPREYSKRLGVLTHEQLQAALDRLDLGDLVAAEPTVAGLFGQNVFLDTSRGRFVLRGCPHTPWQLDQERYFAGLIHERTQVPSPWPYEIDNSSDIFGWPYAIVPRLTGDPPQVLWDKLDREARHAVAEAMGDALGELQAIEAPGCGLWEPELGAVRLTERPFSEWALDRVREVSLHCQETAGIIDAADVRWVEQVIDNNGSAFRIAPTPAFVHTDYAPGNVVVTHDSRWCVTGVFDLQEACFADPEEDLSRTVGVFAIGDVECARRFVAAYARRRPLRPDHAERFRLHMLRDRLVIWLHGRKNRIWFAEDATFRDFARWFVELDVL